MSAPLPPPVFKILSLASPVIVSPSSDPVIFSKLVAFPKLRLSASPDTELPTFVK